MTLALVHSPLTGPFVWEPAAAELARRGIDSTLLEVADHPSASGPFWEQESRAAARSISALAFLAWAGSSCTR